MVALKAGVGCKAVFLANGVYQSAMPFEVSVLVQHLLMVNVKIKLDACCSIYFGNDPVNLARQGSKPVAN